MYHLQCDFPKFFLGYIRGCRINSTTSDISLTEISMNTYLSIFDYHVNQSSKIAKKNNTVIQTKTNKECRRSPNTVTTLLFDSHTARPRIRSPVWYHLITKTQADQIEAIQKRAIRIIYTCTHDMPYVSATFVSDLPTMSDLRDQLSRKFFNSTLQPTSPLHSLLPPLDPLETNYPSLDYEQ